MVMISDFTDTLLLGWSFVVVSFAWALSYVNAFVSLMGSWRKTNGEDTARHPHQIRSVLITGADTRFCSQLAEEYARRLGSEGVLVLQGRNEHELEQVKSRCETRGCRTSTTHFDMTNKEACKSWITSVDNSNPIDLLILGNVITEGNLRDRMASAKGFDVIGEDVMSEITAVNIDGMLNALNPMLDRMRSRGFGQIAIVSSLSAMVATSPVCAAMAWRKNLGISLRNSLANENIRVNVILPDFADPPTTSWPFRPESIAAHFLVQKPEKNAAFVMKCLEANRPVIAFPLLKMLIAHTYHLVPPFTREFLWNVMMQMREMLGVQRKTASQIWGKMRQPTAPTSQPAH